MNEQPAPSLPMTPSDMLGFLQSGSPDWQDCTQVVDAGPGYARIARRPKPRDLGRSGHLLGPTLFWLCDSAFFVAILASCGRPALSATTVSLSMNFMRPAKGQRVEALCRLIEWQGRLIKGEVTIGAGETTGPFVHATGIFSAPTVGRHG